MITASLERNSPNKMQSPPANEKEQKEQREESKEIKEKVEKKVESPSASPSSSKGKDREIPKPVVTRDKRTYTVSSFPIYPSVVENEEEFAPPKASLFESKNYSPGKFNVMRKNSGKQGVSWINQAAKNGNLKTLEILLVSKSVDHRGGTKGHTPLHKASSAGQEHVVRWLLTKGANVAVMDVWGYTAMHLAAMAGHLRVVTMLAEKGASLDCGDKEGNTPILKVVDTKECKNALDVVKLLVELKANVQLCNHKGTTVAHILAGTNQLEILSFLVVEKGYTAVAKDEKGNTPLHVAVMKEHEEIVRFLIHHKQIRSSKFFKNNEGKLPYDVANKNMQDIIKDELQKPLNTDCDCVNIYNATFLGHLNCIQKILPYWHNLDEPNEKGEYLIHLSLEKFDCLSYLLSLGANINIVGEEQDSLLVRAVQIKNSDLVQYLIDSGADKHLANRDEVSPIDMALMNQDDDMCYLLTKNGVDMKPSKVWKNSQKEKVEVKHPFHEAIMSNKKEVVQFLLENGVSPNLLDENGNTPLYLAVQHKFLEVMDVLFQFKSDPNLGSGKDADLPLLIAIKENNLKLTSILLQNGANPSLTSNAKETPLYNCVKLRKIEMMELLLKNKADVNAKSVDGNAPLCVAVGIPDTNDCLKFSTKLLDYGADPNVPNKAGNALLFTVLTRQFFKLSQILLQRGADVNWVTQDKKPFLCVVPHFQNQPAVDFAKLLIQHGASPNVVDGRNCSPLYYAIYNDNVELARELLIAGAVSDQKNESGEWLLHMGIQKIHPAKPDEIGMAEVLLEFKADPNCLNKAGDPALICAIAKKNISLAKTLLKHKADPNLAGAEGHTPLSLVLLTMDDDIARNFAEILLANGAQANSTDKKGNPLLGVAVEKEYVKTAEILLKNGADSNCLMNGKLPLFIAIASKNVPLVELLLKYKADCNAVAEGGEPAICMAVKFNVQLAKDLVDLLLSFGSQVNVLDRAGNTPLFLTVMKGRRYEGVIHKLIESGADINGVNSNGNTILHVAAKYNSPEMLRFLLQKGANPNAKNDSGNSPVHIACKANRPEMLEVLIEFKADFYAMNDLGDTPVHAAAAVPSVKGKNQGLEFLLQRTESWKDFITLKNNREKTPMDIATRDKGNLALMKLRRGEKVDFSIEEEESELEKLKKKEEEEKAKKQKEDEEKEKQDNGAEATSEVEKEEAVQENENEATKQEE